MAIGDREVEFRFNQKCNRELLKIMGDLVVPLKHRRKGTDTSSKKHNITRQTLEIPLGSYLYKVESFKPGTEIV